jgi:hypothetical protein
MRVERRGLVILACSVVNRDDAGGAGERAKAGRQAVCDFQAAGLGGMAKGQGQQGRGCCVVEATPRHAGAMIC